MKCQFCFALDGHQAWCPIRRSDEDPVLDAGDRVRHTFEPTSWRNLTWAGGTRVGTIRQFYDDGTTIIDYDGGGSAMLSPGFDHDLARLST